MPVFSNSGGPWGGGGNSGGGGGGRGPWGGGGDDDRDRNGGGRGPGGGGPGGQGPDIDEIVRRGQEQLRVLMGGGGGGGGGAPDGLFKIFFFGLAFLGVAFWLLASFYTVRPEQRSVELFLGEFSSIGNPGLNFAPWPLVTKELLEVTRERSVVIGNGGRGSDGLMLTGDENIVDIEFEVVWNIDPANPQEFLFNLAEPEDTIDAVAEAAMREVISRSELAPVLNRDRGIIAEEVRGLIQGTLDSYTSGINVVRLNFDRADPPGEVIDAFRDVQAAEQERDRFQNEADAYANQRLAAARGEAAQLLQEAEAYRARVINEAQGEASRFNAVYEEYAKATEVTRKRLYLETLERVLSGVDKIIIDEGVGGEGGGQGVVPYLPLNELRRGTAQATGGSQ